MSPSYDSMRRIASTPDLHPESILEERVEPIGTAALDLYRASN